VFDLREGKFVNLLPEHPHYITSMLSRLLSSLMMVKYEELPSVKPDKTERKQLLQALMQYYQLHINGFGSMKSAEILEEIIS
jgi:DNA repair protein RecO (recombination protein O)